MAGPNDVDPLMTSTHTLDEDSGTTRPDELLEEHPTRKWSYLKSSDFVELLSCMVFCAFVTGLSMAAFSPRERPIPIQKLESGEFVLNLSLYEELSEETVTGKFQNGSAISSLLSFERRVSQSTMDNNHFIFDSDVVLIVVSILIPVIIQLYVRRICHPADTSPLCFTTLSHPNNAVPVSPSNRVVH